MTDRKTTYSVEYWWSTKQLENLLNMRVAEGWRVDSHKLSPDDTGWTIFVKTEQLRAPLLDRTIKVSEVYSILNATVRNEDGCPSEQAREFDRMLKNAVRQDGDEW